MTTCCRCNNASLKSMFMQCPMLMKFWKKVLECINITLGGKLVLSEDGVILISTYCI